MSDTDPDLKTIVVTESLTLEPGATLNARIVVRGSNIVIDGAGATLVGPGKPGDPESFEGIGVAVEAEGCSNVVLKDLSAHGFETGLSLKHCRAWHVEGCDFSDNYHNMAFGWGELPARGGIILRDVSDSVFTGNAAHNVWDGINMTDCTGNLVRNNDFSHCSNVCAKLWTSSRNMFLENDLSYGLRIDREAGEAHARDSTGVLIESGSNDNYWYRNDITYGGDGVFIRPLNGWVSTGNVFIENDTSYGNNNCIESWSPGNVFIRNVANHGSYGFWMGGSDKTVLIGNEAAYNGLEDGFHFATESGFGHGGIVLVHGEGNHSIVDGNHCHHNNGGGIVFRGHVASKGAEFTINHWVMQNNDLHDNKWGVWGQYGDWIRIANNRYADNEQNVWLDSVTNVTEVEGEPDRVPSPKAVLRGPARARVGRPVRFDAASSTDPEGRELSYEWDLGDGRAQGASVEHTYPRAGFYRVGLTVTNGATADLANCDLLVTEEPYEEPWTEGHAADWSDDLEGTGHPRLVFTDDQDAVAGDFSLRIEGAPRGEQPVAAIYRPEKGEPLDVSTRTRLSFWLRSQNPNLPAFEKAGPVLRLISAEGEARFTPANGRNFLSSPRSSEGRWLWARYELPLAGDETWTREDEGAFDPERVTAIAFAAQSGGSEPFTIWIDGLRFD